MKPVAQSKDGTIVAGGQVRIEIEETEVELTVEESEKMREQIRLRATEVGPILEALLRNEAGYEHWGLNE